MKQTHIAKVLSYCKEHGSITVREAAVKLDINSPTKVISNMRLSGLYDVRDIEEGNKYNSDNVKAFKVLKGEAIEVYATTLHFCPIETAKSGFGCVVGLLKGTNTDLDFVPEDKLIFRKNKWIMAHNENTTLLDKGVVGGIYGINHKICEE